MIDSFIDALGLLLVTTMVSAAVGGFVHEQLKNRALKRQADKHHRILERDRERALLKLKIMEIEKEKEK